MECAGHDSDVCPLGLAWPSSRRAVEVPPSWPENHISRIDLTASRHGSRTGLVVLSTTTVFGLAAATLSIRLVLAALSDSGAEMLAGPLAYGFAVVLVALLSLRKTIAIRLPRAAVAASS